MKDRIISIEEIDLIEKTVREGKVDQKKSTRRKGRICFKLYFKQANIENEN